MSATATLTAQQVAPLDGVARVVVADRLALLRHAVASLLNQEPDFTVVGTAATGIEAVDAVLTRRPDIIMLGIDMPGMGGLEAARVIRDRAPSVRILVVTEHTEEDLLVAAVRNGVDGYVLKDLHPDDLVRALRSTMRGESPIAPGMICHLLAELRQSLRPKTLPLCQPAPEDKLSRREREILQHVAQGLSNRQIAQRLSITEGTVKNHMHNALHKLKLSNRMQAANYVMRRGLAD